MQRILYYTLFYFCIFYLNANSQTLDRLKNIQLRPGFAILNTGDTIVGSFEFNDYEDNYKYLVYKDPITLKKVVYSPEKVELFAIDSLYFRPIELNYECVFMRILIEDQLSVYLHKHFYATNMGSGVENQFFVQKPNGEHILISTSKFYPFKTKVGAFIKDHKQLHEKLRKDIYTDRDLFKILIEYNEWLRENR